MYAIILSDPTTGKIHSVGIYDMPATAENYAAQCRELGYNAQVIPAQRSPQPAINPILMSQPEQK